MDIDIRLAATDELRRALNGAQARGAELLLDDLAAQTLSQILGADAAGWLRKEAGVAAVLGLPSGGALGLPAVAAAARGVALLALPLTDKGALASLTAVVNQRPRWQRLTVLCAQPECALEESAEGLRRFDEWGAKLSALLVDSEARDAEGSGAEAEGEGRVELQYTGALGFAPLGGGGAFVLPPAAAAASLAVEEGCVARGAEQAVAEALLGALHANNLCLQPKGEDGASDAAAVFLLDEYGVDGKGSSADSSHSTGAHAPSLARALAQAALAAAADAPARAVPCSVVVVSRSMDLCCCTATASGGAPLLERLMRSLPRREKWSGASASPVFPLPDMPRSMVGSVWHSDDADGAALLTAMAERSYKQGLDALQKALRQCATSEKIRLKGKPPRPSLASLQDLLSQLAEVEGARYRHSAVLEIASATVAALRAEDQVRLSGAAADSVEKMITMAVSNGESVLGPLNEHLRTVGGNSSAALLLCAHAFSAAAGLQLMPETTADGHVGIVPPNEALPKADVPDLLSNLTATVGAERKLATYNRLYALATARCHLSDECRTLVDEDGEVSTLVGLLAEGIAQAEPEDEPAIVSVNAGGMTEAVKKASSYVGGMFGFGGAAKAALRPSDRRVVLLFVAGPLSLAEVAAVAAATREAAGEADGDDDEPPRIVLVAGSGVAADGSVAWLGSIDLGQ